MGDSSTKFAFFIMYYDRGTVILGFAVESDCSIGLLKIGSSTGWPFIFIYCPPDLRVTAQALTRIRAYIQPGQLLAARTRRASYSLS